MTNHDICRLETIDWFGVGRHTNQISLIGYFDQRRKAELERAVRKRWNVFYHSLRKQSRHKGDLEPRNLFGEGRITSSGSDEHIFYIDSTDESVRCFQVPLPRACMKTIERRLLLEESLCLPSLERRQRGALEDELVRVGYAFGHVVDTRDAGGRLLGYFSDEWVKERWGLAQAKYDLGCKRLVIGTALTDRERLDLIRSQLSGDDPRFSIGSQQRMRLLEERSVLRNRVDYPDVDWKGFYRLTSEALSRSNSDYRVSAKVKKSIRGWSKQDDSRGLVNRLEYVNRNMGGKGFELHDKKLNSSELVAEVSDGDQAAIDMVIRLVIESYGGFHAPTTTERQDGPAPGGLEAADDCLLPDWAQAERPFILSWAGKSKNPRPTNVEDDIADYIARRIGKGELCVLVFDSGLYCEVCEADVVEPMGSGLVSFPFPLAIVRMPGIDGVYGVAVFMLDGFRQVARTWEGRSLAGGEGYGTCFVLEDGGVALDVGQETRHAAEKLVTYLNCDNAALDTVFVDGSTSGRKHRPSTATSSEAVTYVRGADLVVGTRVIVERDRPTRGRDSNVGTRRAHFRKGFFSTPENWHARRLALREALDKANVRSWERFHSRRAQG